MRALAPYVREIVIPSSDYNDPLDHVICTCRLYAVSEIVIQGMVTKMVTNNEAVRVREFSLRCANKEKAASLGAPVRWQPLSQGKGYRGRCPCFLWWID